MAGCKMPVQNDDQDHPNLLALCPLVQQSLQLDFMSSVICLTTLGRWGRRKIIELSVPKVGKQDDPYPYSHVSQSGQHDSAIKCRTLSKVVQNQEWWPTKRQHSPSYCGNHNLATCGFGPSKRAAKHSWPPQPTTARSRHSCYYDYSREQWAQRPLHLIARPAFSKRCSSYPATWKWLRLPGRLNGKTQSSNKNNFELDTEDNT